MTNRLRLASIIFALCATGCVRSLTPAPEEALRPVAFPMLAAEVQPDSLREGLAREIRLFESGRGPKQFRFGRRVVARADYLAALRRLHTKVAAPMDQSRFQEFLRESFDLYEAYGNPEWGEVLVTGYYEPTIPGSTVRTADFTQPLYARPPELLPGKVFNSRSEIDSGGLLRGRGLEICFVDPIDATIIQTQGSGVVRLQDGKLMRLVFAGKNNLPYRPIGKFLKDVLPPEKMTLDGIHAYLRGLPEDQLRTILNKNPSYVFFEKHPEGARTALGVQATPGRTIAIDPKIYPQGALAFLSFDHPAPQSSGYKKVSRLVLAQDSGTAIQGPGRVDFFWGGSKEAKFYAGRTKSKGRLYFLAPKENVN